MTDYQTWIARGTAVCDAECAEAMGWERNRRGGLWMGWHDETGYGVAERDWSPTTDRNATAMMVERVVKNDYYALMRLSENLREVGIDGAREALLADPSLVAYCCVRALKEEA
jgi:hypothetical protein